MSRSARVATAVAATVLAAGCTSGSSRSLPQHTLPPESPSVAASVTESPVINPENEAVDSLTGSASVTLSGGSAPVTVSTSADDPAQVSVDDTGLVRLEVSMRAKDGSLFSLAGPAAVGSVPDDHVSVLLPSAGVVVDTQQGNTCTVRYTRAAETGVAGEVRCDAQDGQQSYTVSVSFAVR